MRKGRKFFGNVMDRNYGVAILILKYLLRIPGVATFASIVRISIIFNKATFQDLKNEKI